MVLIPTIPGRYDIKGAIDDSARGILSKEACEFLAALHRAFEGTRQALLDTRQRRQRDFDSGQLPDFLPETKHVRDDLHWRGANPAPGLADRRVEITGPTERKMIVNALNSDVKAFMADFEGKQASVQALSQALPHSLRYHAIQRLLLCP